MPNVAGEWQHCRWFDPHPPIPVPGSYVEAVRATGAPGATCATCGEALVPRVISPGSTADQGADA